MERLDLCHSDRVPASGGQMRNPWQPGRELSLYRTGKKLGSDSNYSH
jgi:hypothetical protein